MVPGKEQGYSLDDGKYGSNTLVSSWGMGEEIWALSDNTAQQTEPIVATVESLS